MVKSTI